MTVKTMSVARLQLVARVLVHATSTLKARISAHPGSTRNGDAEAIQLGRDKLIIHVAASG